MATTYKLTVTAYSLNVRKGPSVNYQAFDWIHKDQKYTASKTQNGWYYIDSLGGWVSGKYVKVETVTTPAPVPKVSNTTSTQQKQEQEKAETILKVEKKIKETKNYVVDTSRSAGANITNANFETINSGAYGDQVDITTSLNINKPNPKFTKPLSVNSNGEFYADVNGFGNFAEYKSTLPVGGDHEQRISGLTEVLNDVRRQLTIYRDGEDRFLFTKFNRFKTELPSVELGRAFPYIFFTKPDIDLLQANGKLKPEIDRIHHTISFIHNNNPEILKSLHSSFGNHRFNIFLSNMARSFDPSDEVIRTVETGETYTGWKTVYGKNTNESNSAGQFSIQYRDNRNLDIMKMHKAWIEYMNGVYRGSIEVSRNVIHKKILNYACSLYYIVCAEDGETILYWEKYYGVFPINVPSSVFGWAAGSPLKPPEFTVTYMYALRDAYDPVILAEFNTLSDESRSVYKKTYNSSNAVSSSSWSGTPFIEVGRNRRGEVVYKLRFRM